MRPRASRHSLARSPPDSRPSPADPAQRDRDASKFDIRVKCYMLELYRDELVDLLLPPKQYDRAECRWGRGRSRCVSRRKPPPLSIHKDSKGVVYVENVTIRDVESADELFRLLDEVRRPPRCLPSHPPRHMWMELRGSLLPSSPPAARVMTAAMWPKPR